jgi:hypothetical protein
MRGGAPGPSKPHGGMSSSPEKPKPEQHKPEHYNPKLVFTRLKNSGHPGDTSHPQSLRNQHPRGEPESFPWSKLSGPGNLWEQPKPKETSGPDNPWGSNNHSYSPSKPEQTPSGPDNLGHHDGQSYSPSKPKETPSDLSNSWSSGNSPFKPKETPSGPDNSGHHDGSSYSPSKPQESPSYPSISWGSKGFLFKPQGSNPDTEEAIHLASSANDKQCHLYELLEWNKYICLLIKELKLTEDDIANPYKRWEQTSTMILLFSTRSRI